MAPKKLGGNGFKGSKKKEGRSLQKKLQMLVGEK